MWGGIGGGLGWTCWFWAGCWEAGPLLRLLPCPQPQADRGLGAESPVSVCRVRWPVGLEAGLRPERLVTPGLGVESRRELGEHQDPWLGEVTWVSLCPLRAAPAFSAQRVIDLPRVLGGPWGAWWVLLHGPGLVLGLVPPPTSSCPASGPTASGTSLRAGHPGLSVQAELSLPIPSHRAPPAQSSSCPHPPPPATAPRDRSPRRWCMP